jgi:hypothetical protein
MGQVSARKKQGEETARLSKTKPVGGGEGYIVPLIIFKYYLRDL